MTLRRKLMLSQLPLVIALGVTVAGALYAELRFGSAPGEILHENFRSFDAMRSMLHSVDAVDQQALSAHLSAEPIDPHAREEPLGDFERELRLQESNITEEGEAEATKALRTAWNAYEQGLTSASGSFVFIEHRQRSRRLREAVDAILQMNRDAMQRKSRAARRESERLGAGLTAVALLGFALAVFVSGVWLRRILAPVRVLEKAVERLARGDFDARIRVKGSDEIAALSSSFNQMAGRLSEYRRSSVGQLLELNSRLESVMDSFSAAVMVYALEGATVIQNEVATRLLGSPSRMGTLPEALLEPVQRAFESVRETGEPYEPASLEAAVEVPGPSATRWMSVTATPVRTGDGVLTGVTVALRDVSRFRRLEGFKGDLVAAAAHELRTPLTSLHMAVHLCLEHAAGPLTERQEDLLSAARVDCERLQAVVEELLEMARLESGAARLARSELNAGELIRATVARHEQQARRTGQVLEAIPGDSLLTVTADGPRTQRVLDNLVENAFRHAGEGRRVQMGYERQDDSVCFFVDDSGPGVPLEHREQVFAKFFRVPGTEKQGSGLGLSIVADIVRAHGGDLGVEESPLGGARFWFSLPSGELAGQSSESGSS